MNTVDGEIPEFRFASSARGGRLLGPVIPSNLCRPKCRRQESVLIHCCPTNIRNGPFRDSK